MGIPFRIGTGAGFSADRLDPAVDLVQRGELDCLVFECVGERTLAFGHRDRMRDPAAGYNKLLAPRFRAILPLAREHGTRVITNMGAANPRAAAERTVALARELGLRGLRVACVEGDDVTARIGPETALPELGRTVGEVSAAGQPLVGANAYIGADALLPALEAGADVIVAGRVADPSLFLAPMRHAFGWGGADWARLGAGTAVGHLLECAAQVTGGYFADPGVKPVENLAYVGFPIAEVAADGSAVITKLPQTGGCVTLRTVKEQLLYEIHDPARYFTPDVVADFSTARLAEAGADRVAVSGAVGRARPDQLKVTVAFDGGVLAEAEVGYAGPGAKGRARLAGEIVAERMAHVHGFGGELRIDLIGVGALHGSAVERPAETQDVRVRAALRTSDRELAEALLWEVESLLCCGPAGGGGFRGHVTPSVVTHSAFLSRDQVTTRVEVLEA
ncbi:MAG TPA: acyclic terpene utilization AtuA family protein [bacterium]|nr:acyclic terpene utilization AtuA family protein [bacterium]